MRVKQGVKGVQLRWAARKLGDKSPVGKVKRRHLCRILRDKGLKISGSGIRNKVFFLSGQIFFQFLAIGLRN